MQTGYTALMLKTLEKPCNIFVDGGVRSVKTPSSAVVDTCFERMQNWLELVRMTVRAEMPHFESLQLFRIFSLDATPNMEDAKRLANLLDLDAECFCQRFLDMRPSAEWHYLEGGSKPSEDAWRSAHLKNRSKAFPNKTLEAALIRLFSWQINTSGVERAFAKGLHAARKRGDVGEHHLDDELQPLSLNKAKKGKPAALPRYDALIESARTAWTNHYGPPRNRQKVPEDLKGPAVALFCFMELVSIAVRAV